MKNDETNLISRVSKRLHDWSEYNELFKYGQKDSLVWIANNIEKHGLVIADEVGLGKTWLALLTMFAYLEEGANVAAVVPAGLLLQWSNEVEKLNQEMSKARIPMKQVWKPKIIRSFQGVYECLNENEDYPIVDNINGNFALISQQFDIYQLVNGENRRTPAIKLSLPCVVAAKKATLDGVRGPNKFKTYIHKSRFNKPSQLDEYNQLATKKILKAADYLAQLNFPKDISTLLSDSRIVPSLSGNSKADSETIEFFKMENGGGDLLRKLSGYLIGKIDLVVVDEAHKSKIDENLSEEVNKSRIDKLLSKTLVYSSYCRRLTMTATPIEIEPSDWKSILKRSGINEKTSGYSETLSAINDFSIKLNYARKHSDEVEAINSLIEASKKFESYLSKFVTRRRRINQDEMIKLLPSELPNNAHPHRSYSSAVLKIEELNSNWKKIVLALEGQGVSAKGDKSIDMKTKQADIRYSHGLYCDVDIDSINNEEVDSDRKRNRSRAWQKLQRKLIQAENAGKDRWLWNHPRITKALDRIEELCNFEGISPKEKVLVFGRFTKPMEILNDFLNYSQVLRSIDLGKVIYFKKINPDEMDKVFSLYENRWEKGHFSGYLKNEKLTKIKLLNKIKKANVEYKKASRKLKDIFDQNKKQIFSDQSNLKDLTAFLREFPKQEETIIDFLRFEIFDLLMSQGKNPGAITRLELTQYLDQTWTDHSKNLDTRYDDMYANDIKMDNFDRKLKPEEIAAYFDHESRSSFSRILNGQTAQETRRAMQAGFNRKNVGPYVIVAQSIVGREGLNLHEQCRRVFIFHPEWNPGVMEQQIGRVDRIKSLWTSMAEEWNKKKQNIDAFPKIEIESLVFCGTYDEYQANILKNRQDEMNAQLFGELLPSESLEKIIDRNLLNKLQQAAPNFEPRKKVVR